MICFVADIFWIKILPNKISLLQICDWEGAEEAEQEAFNAWVKVTYDQGLLKSLMTKRLVVQNHDILLLHLHLEQLREQLFAKTLELCEAKIMKFWANTNIPEIGIHTHIDNQSQSPSHVWWEMGCWWIEVGCIEKSFDWDSHFSQLAIGALEKSQFYSSSTRMVTAGWVLKNFEFCLKTRKRGKLLRKSRQLKRNLRWEKKDHKKCLTSNFNLFVVMLFF